VPAQLEQPDWWDTRAPQVRKVPPVWREPAVYRDILALLELADCEDSQDQLERPDRPVCLDRLVQPAIQD